MAAVAKVAAHITEESAGGDGQSSVYDGWMWEYHWEGEGRGGKGDGGLEIWSLEVGAGSLGKLEGAWS